MTSIERAIQLKRQLDKLRPLKRDDELRIMQKFRLDWNYHSNHLEGNTLTHGETKALILFGITAEGKTLREHFEITGHDEAVKWVMEVIHQQRPLNETFVLELHKLILKEPYKKPSIDKDGIRRARTINVGVYKTSPNHVLTKTAEIFRFATPEETPAKMRDLLDWYHLKMKDENTNPILLAVEFHYRYIRIHPFDDGNGRTARILMNFILMQNGYPPVIIKTEDKENYFRVLRRADADDLNPFIEYITQNLIRSLEIMIRGAKGESIEEEEDLKKGLALLEQRLKGIGEPVEIAKSRETLLNLFDTTLSKLIERFIEKCSMLDKFYGESVLAINLNSTDEIDVPNKNDIFKAIKSYLHKKELAEEFDISYTYNYFKNKKLNIDFRSELKFTFGDINYGIFSADHDIDYIKFYQDSLTKAEIEKFTNQEIKRHKDYIEQAIAELESNND